MLSSLCIILLVIIPVYFFIYYYHNYVLTQEFAKQATINTLQSKTLFDNMTEDFHRSYGMASSSNAILEFLKAEEDEAVDRLAARAQDFVGALLKSSNLVDETYLYSFANDRMLSSRACVPVGLDNKYEWLRTYRSTKLPFIMFPRKENSETFNCYYICSQIRENGQLVGLFCSKMDYGKFVDIVLTSFEQRPDQIFIVSSVGLILYSDNPGLINATMFERDDTYAAFTSATREGGNYIVYDDYIISIARSTKSQLLIMSYIRKDSIVADYAFISVLIASGLAVVLLTSISLAMFFSYRQYRSIAQVMQVLEKPDTLRTKLPRLSEFLYITHSISDITRQNKTISDDLTEKILQLKNAQIAALQAQINPHFLFNTLQLINLSIMSEMKRDTVSTLLIAQLSALVRAAYDTDRFIITVREEIEITRNYLSIQQARYNARLSVTFEVADECLNETTIKLLLQPLVENSIVHGFKGQEGPWNLGIYCHLENGYLVYHITDNGEGMPQDAADRIKRMLGSNDVGSGDAPRVGIANVYQRLKLVYGRHCSMEIRDNPGGRGTSIVIRHPVDGLSEM